MTAGRNRTGFVVVAHKVVFPVVISGIAGTFTTVAGVAAPVVHHIVGDGYGALLVGNIVVVQAWIAAVVVGQEVVMVSGIRATPDATVPVIALSVHGGAKALGDNIPGEGKVFHAIERGAFVGTPANGAVVDNNFLERIAVFVHYLHGVVLGLLLVPHPAADETDNDVAGMNPERVILQADTVAGGGLTGNGEISLLDLQLFLKRDGSGHVKNNGERALGILNAIAERTLGVVVVQGRHMVNLAPAAAGGEHAAAFCTRESTGHAVLFRCRNAEFLIGNLGVSGICTGVYRIFLPCRFGLKGSTGALAVPHYGKYRELIRGSFGEPVHFHIAVRR